MPRSSLQKAKRPWPTLKLDKSSFPLGKWKDIGHRGLCGESSQTKKNGGLMPSAILTWFSPDAFLEVCGNLEFDTEDRVDLLVGVYVPQQGIVARPSRSGSPPSRNCLINTCPAKPLSRLPIRGREVYSEAFQQLPIKTCTELVTQVGI